MNFINKFLNSYSFDVKIDEYGFSILKALAFQKANFNIKLVRSNNFQINGRNCATILSRAYVNDDTRLIDFLLNHTNYLLTDTDIICMIHLIHRFDERTQSTFVDTNHNLEMMRIVKGLIMNKNCDVNLCILLSRYWNNTLLKEDMHHVLCRIENHFASMVDVHYQITKVMLVQKIPDEARLAIIERVVKYISSTDIDIVEFVIDLFLNEHKSEDGKMNPEVTIKILKLFLKNVLIFIPVERIKMFMYKFRDAPELYIELAQTCAYKLLSFIVYASDGFIEVDENPELERFIMITKNLPLEIQFMTCCSAYGIKNVSYSSKRFNEILFI